MIHQSQKMPIYQLSASKQFDYMNIAITGSSGMLGSSFIDILENKKLNFFSVSRENYNLSVPLNEVVNYFESNKTSLIVHCAANTDVEFCETNPDNCFNDNVISSTGVYGDYKNSPYKESDSTKPTTVYHQSKLEAEKIIISTLKDYLIIRTGWLFGGTQNSPKNFVINRLLEAKKSDGKIFSNSDQKGNPTYTTDVVKTILKLIESQKNGLFNCVNEGVASRFDYVNEILGNSNYQTLVEGISKSAFNRKANVPNNEMALNHNLSKIGLNQMPDWKISLKKYMSSFEIDHN
jgi:dTDP-4-dehydrorhamnose reductase